MDAELFSNILNVLVMATIIISVVGLGLFGYPSLKEKWAVMR